jgi:hypothetical protein
MATKGTVQIRGVTRDGDWIISPSPAAIDVLIEAMRQGDRQIVITCPKASPPTRCKGAASLHLIHPPPPGGDEH